MTGERPYWRVRHRAVTGSTNKDALGGMPGDVFTADHQTAGRGRLDHRWLSPPGENLMMSAVIDVSGAPPEEVATLPLVVGLAAAAAVADLLAENGGSPLRDRVRIKWPNDVLIGGRKVGGILCERSGGNVIAGIGINVNQTEFAPEIAARATSLRMFCSRLPVEKVRNAVLDRLGGAVERWRHGGFRSLWPDISGMDFLKGRTVSVRRTDDDGSPAAGVCGGIRPDGSLDVGGEPVFAGEAHVCA